MPVHPITVIEILVSFMIIFLFLIISFKVPQDYRKISLHITIVLTVSLMAFFAFRPLWIDYQVDIKKAALHQYLQNRYHNEEWKIRTQSGRQYNPFHLNVEFLNEKGWTYTYSVVEKKSICQSGWGTPDGKVPDQGMHFESDHCD